MKSTLLFWIIIVSAVAFCAEDCSLTVAVRDEQMLPVSNVFVRVSVICKNKINAGISDSDWANYSSLTDTNGLATVQFQCFLDGAYEWSVSSADCYCPGLQRASFNGDGQDASPENSALIEAERAKIAAGTGGSWLQIFQLMNPSFTLYEHASTNEVIVVRKRNPQSMYQRDSTNSYKLNPLASIALGDGIVSNAYPRVGFDLKEGEYLMPYGDGGEFADFWVEQYCIVSNDVKTYVGHIDFPPGCGVYRAQKEDRELGPICFAADTSQTFTNRLDFTCTVRGRETIAVNPLARGNEYLVFHTRVADNGDGTMSAGNYSMMEGSVRISGGISFHKLIFNHRPGDTNLEMDVRKNCALGWREEWDD